MDRSQSFRTQLEDVLKQFRDEVRPRSKHHDLSDLTDESMRFITTARAAIHRVAGSRSTYGTQCEEIIQSNSPNGFKVRYLFGVVQALQEDLAKGYLRSLEELVHAELFADFLEMAQHLLNEGFKDAAAVIAGSSLEAHLRQLCQKNTIDVEVASGADVAPKKADRLNSDLASANVYGKLDQKSVTAWLDLRNKAAHGKYGEYEKAQVGLMVAGIRDFITRNPA